MQCDGVSSAGLLTCMTLILEADSPLLILTVRGMGMPSAIPATSRPSLVGLRSSAAPKPRLVASEHTLYQLEHRPLSEACTGTTNKHALLHQSPGDVQAMFDTSPGNPRRRCVMCAKHIRLYRRIHTHMSYMHTCIYTCKCNFIQSCIHTCVLLIYM